MNRDLMNRIITVLLVLLLARYIAEKCRDLVVEKSNTGGVAARVQASWNTLTTRRDPVFGDHRASFKIVEFMDYQCPFCAIVDPVLNEFVANHAGDVALYRYDMPLTDIHRYAYKASIAAACAQLQGVGAKYHSLLFQHQKELPSLDWSSLARQSGVINVDLFTSCVKAEAPKEQINRDIWQGMLLGINATPTVIIDGEIVSNRFSGDALERLYKRRKNRNVFDRILRWR